MCFILLKNSFKEENSMRDEKAGMMKPLEEMDVIDDFLFTEIMSDEKDGAEVCRMILSLVLKREIGDISFTAQRIVPGISESSHGIRLDAYITEHLRDRGTGKPGIRVYDVEPDKQSSKKELLPKRSRYYEAGSVIKTHPDIPYDDGVRRIYLYVDGELPEGAGEEDRKLKNLLRYIGKSTKANITDDLTDRLNDIVHKAKAKKGVGVRYMKTWEREKELREEGREEGREEERKNTEAERKKAEAARKRADKAEMRADKAEARVRELEAKLANIT